MHRQTLPLLAKETFWQLQLYLRDRVAVFFTFAFPLLILFFWSRQEGRNPLSAAAFVGSLSLAMAGYAGLAMGIAAARENGVLRRIRSTPLPLGLHIAARVLASGGLGTLALALSLGVGWLILGLPLSWRTLLGLLPGVLAGFVALGSWGLVVGSLVKSATAASYLVNATLFPLFLLSVAAQRGLLPEWAAALLPWLPLEGLALLVRQALAQEGGLWGPLPALLAWGGLGLGLAAWRLSRPL